MSKLPRTGTTYTGPAPSDPAATAGLRARLARVSPLQAIVNQCVSDEDALLARRRAAHLARLPMGERISPSFKSSSTPEGA